MGYLGSTVTLMIGHFAIVIECRSSFKYQDSRLSVLNAAHSFSVFNNSNPQCIWISHTNKSGTAVKGLLYFIQNTNPKEDKYLTRSIMKFDMIWFQIFALKIAMSTFRRHWLNEPCLHTLSHTARWLQQHEALQHIDEHYILEAEVCNSPAAHPRGPRVHTLK